MAKPHTAEDVRDLKAWAETFPNAQGAYETACWVATYEQLRDERDDLRRRLNEATKGYTVDDRPETIARNRDAFGMGPKSERSA